MKIAESNVDLCSSHRSAQRSRRRVQLSYWEGTGARVESDPGRAPPAGPRRPTLAIRAERGATEASISARAAALQPRRAHLEPGEGAGADDPVTELEVSILKCLVEHMTGRAIRVFRPSDLKPGSGAEAALDAQAPEQSERVEPEGRGWGLVYDYYESHYEAESTSFSAQGLVRTADGAEIAVRLDLRMSREFFSEERLGLRAGDALKDPLVVNFAGTAAQLTQERFGFDLDLDGREEQIAFVTAGTGFLALDRNNNGRVDHGGELFGPLSGDGFAELATHDDDANGWIDENDAIYSRLRIWSRDGEGNDQLVGLGQRGVGAIYLGHLTTPFQLKDPDSELLGQVRSTGLFLGEAGAAGTVQQLDLKV
jgi:hypothetical protein